MSKLYPKLAAVNMKNNRQFYLPYLLVGILSAAMFYLMVSMKNSPGLEQMPGGANVRMILEFGIVVIGLFVSIFLFYTNSFIIKRRKKELGVYNILGMEKRHIAKVLFLETLFTAVIAIGGGLLFGIIFNKLLSMLLYRLTGLTESIPFYISEKGCADTVLLFAVVYAAVHAYNLMQIKLSNPIELLHGGNVGEKEPKTKVLMTIFGVICLGVGYYLALTVANAVDAISFFFVAVLFVIVGTYCLFTAGSIAFLKLLRKNKNFYYRAKHFTSVSGMLYRMKQNAAGLSNICILSTMVLVTISTTVCMYLGIEDSMETRYPSELMVASYYNGVPEKQEELDQAIEDSLKASGRTILEHGSYANIEVTTLRKGNELSPLASGLGTEYNFSEVTMLTILPREDYEEYTGNKVVDLKAGEVALAASFEYQDSTLVFGQREYQLKQTFEYPKEVEQNSVLIGGEAGFLIVPDMQELNEIYQGLSSWWPEDGLRLQLCYNMQFDIDGTPEEKLAAEQAAREVIAEWEGQNGNGISTFNGTYVEARQEERGSFYVLYGGLFFLGLFLGTLFLMVTVLIIFYKQISEGYEDKERFAIMEKVGMSNVEVKRTIHAQILTVFFLPLVVAVIHVICAFPMITKLLAGLNLTNIPLFTVCLVGTAIVFGVIYLIVFLLTSRSYYKIVGNQA